MANTATQFRIEAIVRGVENVEALKGSVKRLQSTVPAAANDLNQLRDATTKLGKASDLTENALRTQIAVLRDLRGNVQFLSKDYRDLTVQIQAAERQLARGEKSGGRLSRFGQTAGAIAAGGVFGGPEGLIGGAIGAFTPVGAIGGAAIGASVNMFRQQITGAGDYGAELARLRIALKGVSTDQAEFSNSLKFIDESSARYLLNLKDTTVNYTRLQAAVRGSGLQAKDTQTIFNGLSSAIVASGGGTEQLNGAMVAATQVLSKGKVSAEELLQIAERLPGTYTLFAQAVNKTPQEIAEALKKGKVTTQDFITFTEALFKRYGKTAESIGESTFSAGLRLQLALNNLQLAAGNALLPITTFFANLGTEAANALTRVFEGTTNWQKAIGNTFDNVMKLIGGVTGLKQILVGLTQTLVVLGTTMAGVFAVQNIGTFVKAFETVVTVTKTLVRVTKELLTLEKAMTALKAIQAGLQAIITAAGTNLKKNAKGALGVAAAVGVGALAAAQLKDDFEKVIDGLFSGVGKKFNELFKTPELGGQFGGKQPQIPELDSTNTDTEAERKRRLNDLFQRELDLLEAKQNLLRQQGKLSEENALTEFQKAVLAKQQVDADIKAERERIALQEKFGKVSADTAKIQKQALDIQEKTAKISYQNKQKEISDKLIELENSFFGTGGKFAEQLTPFQERVRSLGKDLQDAIEKAAALGGPQGNKLLAKFRNVTGADLEQLAATGDISKLQDQLSTLQRMGGELTTLQQLQKEYGKGWDDLNEATKRQLESLAKAIDSWKQIGEIVNNVSNVLGNAITQSFDLLITGAGDWKDQLRDIAANALRDIARELLRILVIEQIIASIKGALGGLLNPGGGGGGSFGGSGFNPIAFTPGLKLNAAGAMYAQNGIVPFATGGIVDRPTLFKFANGTGLMGEAGPEAIIPLKRGRDGKLGVAGGDGTVVNVSVDAKGTSVQGDSTQGAALGRVIAGAVQAELIKQKRPGGLLAA